MTRRARMLLVFLVLVAAAGWRTSAAHAEFGPIELVSKSTTEQATEAAQSVISADGRYLVFVGRINGQRGIFRKDLSTGAIKVVAEFSAQEDLAEAGPSISGDGRYVAFTTMADLDPADDDPPPPATPPSDRDVYVADLSTSPPSYELASALDGCDPAVSIEPCGISYAAGGGSVAARRVAISEDGRRVAFVTRGESDLAGPGTPPGQVAVRDLSSHRTYLMTVEEGTDEPVPGGGIDSGTGGAAISGDGSTVAWSGAHLPGQVPMLSDEEAAIRSMEEHPAPEPKSSEYHEPLWRRIPNPVEQDPPTRRVVGGGDPLASGCPPDGTLSISACQGPFPALIDGRRAPEDIGRVEGVGWGTAVPQLDRDGGTVAFIGNPDEDKDLFVVDMAPGLSRRQATRRLTQWVNPTPDAPSYDGIISVPKYLFEAGTIEECAISSDGKRIAFTTTRQVFPLAPPTLVSPTPPGFSEVRELYQVDLRGETIERATPGKSGGVSNEGFGATSPSYGEDGVLLAFADTAGNLVVGDTNRASDAFVVESPPAAPIEATKISPRPAQLTLQPLWRMTVTTATLPDGRVRLAVGVPGSGSVKAEATARLGRRLRERHVSSSSKRAAAAGVQALILALPKKLRHLAKRKGGLYAQLDVGFEGPGGKPLHAAVDVRFLVHRRAVKGRRKGRR
jgi:Tol biopolymer transport system component